MICMTNLAAPGVVDSHAGNVQLIHRFYNILLSIYNKIDRLQKYMNEDVCV